MSTPRMNNLYILLGEDDIRGETFVNNLKSELAKAGVAFDYEVVSCDEIGIPFLIEKILTPSLFFEKKILVLKNFSSIAAPEELLPLFQRLARDKNHPVITIVKWSWSKEAESLLAKAGLEDFVVNFFKGKDWAIKKELREKARQDGYIIDEDALDLLLEHTGEDYTQVYQEYEKLKLATEKRRITREVIEEIASPTKRYPIWELARAFQNRDRKRALSALSNLLTYGEEIEGIVGYLAGVLFRMLAGEKSGFGSEPVLWKKREIAERLKELYEIDKVVKTRRADKASLLLRWLGRALE